MSSSVPRSLLESLRQHTRLVFFLGLLAAFVAIPVATGEGHLAAGAGATMMVGGLLEHAAHRYVTADRPRRTLEALSYVFLAASVAMSLAIVWPLLAL